MSIQESLETQGPEAAFSNREIIRVDSYKEASLTAATFDGVRNAMQDLVDRPDAMPVAVLPGTEHELGVMWSRFRQEEVAIPDSIAAVVFSQPGIEATRKLFVDQGIEEDVLAQLVFNKETPGLATVSFVGSISLLADHTILVQADCYNDPTAGLFKTRGFEVLQFARSLGIDDVWARYSASRVGTRPSYRVLVNNRMGGQIRDALANL